MAITLELPVEEEQNLRRQAEQAGREVTDYLREILRERATPIPVRLSNEEWERLLDEFGEGLSAETPLLSDYAVSREGIYGDHD